jgi:Ca2+-binding RTX toxin-like protein
MRLRTVLIAAAVLMALPVNALAATASVNSEGELHYTAAAGEANAVQISEVPPDIGDESPAGAYTITDQGAVIVAGDGCVQLGEHQVSCSPLINVFIFLGDLADTAELIQGGGNEIGVYGGTGADRLTLCIGCHGGLEGGPGRDVLQAGDFGSSLVGGGGADAITGGSGYDQIYGDRIGGGTGNDTIASGGYNDDISPGGGDDHVDAGAGFDHLGLGEAPKPVVVDLRAGTATGYGMKTLISIETVGGTTHADRLYGDRGVNWIWGNGGGDLLSGRGGRDILEDNGSSFVRDRLFGGFGRDWLRGGRGPDLLVGGRGDDYLVGGPGSDRMLGWSGADRLNSRFNDQRRDFVAGGRGVDRARVDRGLDLVRSVEVFF